MHVWDCVEILPQKVAEHAENASSQDIHIDMGEYHVLFAGNLQII